MDGLVADGIDLLAPAAARLLALGLRLGRGGRGGEVVCAPRATCTVGAVPSSTGTSTVSVKQQQQHEGVKGHTEATPHAQNDTHS